MKKAITVFTVLILSSVFVILDIKTSFAKPQTSCPVMGDPVNKKIYTDYEGYRIYFCCDGCPQEFKKNPRKYMKKLKDSGVTLEKAPAKGKSSVPVEKAVDHSKHKH